VTDSTVSSAKSPRVTAVRALHSRRGRNKAGSFLVEGPQAVEAALHSGALVTEVFVLEADVSWSRAAQSVGARVTRVAPEVMEAMAQTEQPQGVLAVCPLLVPASLASLMNRSGPILVLESLADPGNVGTAIRTADAVGAAGVIVTLDSADIHNGKVVRATAGSLFHLPIATGASVEDIATAAHAASRSLAVATGDGDVDLFAAVDSGSVGDSTVWLVGSEAHGVSEQARTCADLTVSIPMTGSAESLNAAVAAAIVLYVARHGERTSPQSK
jgi:TrmH family RNA methyltransferase